MKISIATPTHDPRWLRETWASLLSQTKTDFEWIVAVNDSKGDNAKLEALIERVREIVNNDPRVRIVQDGRSSEGVGIGKRKKTAFFAATGEVIVELDHDDLLVPSALEEIEKAFSDPEIGFVYSDNAHFQDGIAGQGDVTYRRSDTRPGWVANGFEFYDLDIDGVRPGIYECVRAFEPSAASLSLIFWAPDHVRVWRRGVYEAIGGHNPDLQICDDHELMIRTYNATKMKRIPRPLYLYRVSGSNTWLANVSDIRSVTHQLQSQYIESLVLRECGLLGKPAFDIGSGVSPRPGWFPVDIESRPGTIQADLMQRWPFEDNSVGAFRAMDLLEHLPDKLHTMREIWRCLRPGGWLLSMTPSTDGRGAFMDPTHVSYWNQNSFWYWTRHDLAKYVSAIGDVKFQEQMLSTLFPTPWHVANNISYVQANLVALKPGYAGPGERLI